MKRMCGWMNGWIHGKSMNGWIQCKKMDGKRMDEWMKGFDTE